MHWWYDMKHTWEIIVFDQNYKLFGNWRQPRVFLTVLKKATGAKKVFVFLIPSSLLCIQTSGEGTRKGPTEFHSQLTYEHMLVNHIYKYVVGCRSHIITCRSCEKNNLKAIKEEVRALGEAQHQHHHLKRVPAPVGCTRSREEELELRWLKLG